CLRAGGGVVAWAPGLAASPPAGRSLWDVLEWLARYPEGERVDEQPPRVAEAVAFVTRTGAELEEPLTAVRRAGAETRSWLIGAGAGPSMAGRAVGLGWPL